MSMINTKREKVNKTPYIVTDYMYEGDNVGINLYTLRDCNTTKTMKIPCIPISTSENYFTKTTSEISIIANLVLGEKDSIDVAFDIAYPDKTDTCNVSLDDTEFATDMINTCILDKRNIKDLACYKRVFNEIIDKIKQEALTKNILIKTPELNYKCYVYTEDYVFLGTANRLLANSSYNQYILGEYCGKNLTDYIDEYGDETRLVIDICINKDITLQMRNVVLNNAINSSFGYVSLNLENAKVKQNGTYDSISYKIPEGFVLPEYRAGFDI